MHFDLIPVVAVPARNEEQRLPDLVAALGRQTWLASAGRRLDVTVVLNNCSDGSMRAAARAARSQPGLAMRLIEVAFPPGDDHVGSARRLAIDRALAGSERSDRVVVMTTDADAAPAPDWIAANLKAVVDGADLVGGLIIGDETEEAGLGPRFLRRAALQARYAEAADRLASLVDPIAHDPWPRHRDHVGASLAVRATVYRDCGGLPALPLREDLGLVRRARLRGFRLRHEPAARVRVSARLQGRAPGGMADTIKGWVAAEALGSPLLVEAPHAVEARLLRRSLLRRLDPADPRGAAAAARALGMDVAVLRAILATSPNGVAIVERLAPDEPDAPAGTPVERAIALLAEMIADRERRDAA